MKVTGDKITTACLSIAMRRGGVNFEKQNSGSHETRHYMLAPTHHLRGSRYGQKLYATARNNNNKEKEEFRRIILINYHAEKRKEKGNKSRLNEEEEK